jgi:ATP-binding cassette subfamily B (MDR/TAP) protein 1
MFMIRRIPDPLRDSAMPHESPDHRAAGADPMGEMVVEMKNSTTTESVDSKAINPNPPAAAAAAAAVQTVPLFKLFEFSDNLDRILMLLGSLAAMANGLTFPFMTLLFGQVIDAFGQNSDSSDRVQREVNKVIDRNISLVLITNYADL